jgi:hypothetical protein
MLVVQQFSLRSFLTQRSTLEFTEHYVMCDTRTLLPSLKGWYLEISPQEN